MKIPRAFLGKHHQVRKKLTPFIRHLLKHRHLPTDFLEDCIDLQEVQAQNLKVAMHHWQFSHEEVQFRLYRFWDVIHHELEQETIAGNKAEITHFFFDLLLPYPWGLLAMIDQSSLTPCFKLYPEVAFRYFERFLEDFEVLRRVSQVFKAPYQSQRGAFWNYRGGTFLAMVLDAGIPQPELERSLENGFRSDEAFVDLIRSYILHTD